MSAEQVDAAGIAGGQRFGHLPGRQFAKHGQDPLLGKLQVLSAGITEEAEPREGIADQPVGALGLHGAAGGGHQRGVADVGNLMGAKLHGFIIAISYDQRMPQIRNSIRLVLPVLLLLVLYWPGLTTWFYQDDFGWLNLRHDVHSVRGLAAALFAPKAHGNMRPLGENAYFLVLSSLFGVEALPFRIWAFATQMASLVLLGSVVRRLTASRAAGFWAQVRWIASSGLAAAMCWTSIYNQILSGFFFLLAFWFLLRHIESGAARDAIGHWAAFVLGLGALETNVVYPAIAAVYTLLFARAYLKKVLPMFLVSAVFILVHFRFAPPPRDGVYALHFGGRIFSSLWTYWTWALGPSRLAFALLSCAVLGLLVWSVRARQWIPLFGVAWFVIVIGPYLPKC